MNNIFWALGCYTRVDVKLAEHTFKEKSPLELTDIDILGIRILPDFAINFLLADCTSNRNIIRSPIQRVFWLRGVMEFFNASHSYLCLGSNNPIQETQRVVAQKLGVTILNEDNLANLEKRIINSDAPQLQLNKFEPWLYFEHNLTVLSKDLSRLISFRKYNYWLNPKYQNLHAIISIVKKHNRFVNEKDKLHKALIFDLLTLFVLSLLQMSAYVFNINPENPEMELKSYFYGGYIEMKKRREIVDNIKKIINSQNQKLLFDDILKLDPDYLTNLFEIGFRFLNKPYDASQVLRYLQVFLFEKILYNEQNQQGMEYLESFPEITKKLTRDIIKFFCNATSLTEKLFI